MTQLFSPLIARWADLSEFAKEVGTPEKTAREWHRNDSIPATWFAAVVRAAISRGFIDITADRLADLAERTRLAKLAQSRQDSSGQAAA